MSTPANVAAFRADAHEAPPAVIARTRPLYWSVRRELWENRSIYIAPLAAGIVGLCGFAISAIGMPERRRAVLLLDAAQQRATIGKPYDMVAMLLFLTALLVGIFYCLDALHGERRDRSILFWKSLPVSDLTTVVAKMSIPLVVLPLIAFAVVVVTQFAMLLYSSVVLFSSGLAGTTWSRFHLVEQSLIALYGFIVISLWHAPLYGWLLLISAWAKRAAFLWAVLPLLVTSVLERIAFRSDFFQTQLQYRLVGGIDNAFVFKKGGMVDSLTQLTPGRYLATTGLWIGLVFAAACLFLAVRLRRERDSQ